MLNIFITALLFLLFAPIQSVFMTDDFDTRPLSEKGKKAYENLIVATRFEDAVVGYGGTLSVYARSLEVLINEEKGADAFKSLLEDGTLPARLYAICGLYYTDRTAFEAAVNELSKSVDKVAVQSGCEIYEESVGKIVESKAPNVAIIGPDETLEQYLAGNNNRGYNIDIANGGYQATFRHFVKKEKERAN